MARFGYLEFSCSSYDLSLWPVDQEMFYNLYSSKQQLTGVEFGQGKSDQKSSPTQKSASFVMRNISFHLEYHFNNNNL